MKALLKLIVFASVIFLIAISCQKILSNEDAGATSTGKDFGIATAKNWYYGTFIKTAESQTADKDKKLPDWKNGTLATLGKWNVVVFPFINAKSSFSVLGNGDLIPDQCKKVAEASLSKIAFIKKEDGQIMVREIDYIPDWQYLQSKQFDISAIKGLKDNTDFTGRMIVKNWDGTIVSSQMIERGKTIKMARLLNGKANKTSFADGPVLSAVTCTTQQFCTWQRDCTLTIYGDGTVTDECGPWYNTGECWEETNCSGDGGDDPCGTYGGCNPPPPPEPQCNMTESDAENALNSVTSQITINHDYQNGGMSYDGATGITIKPVAPKGVGVTLHIYGSYSPHWRTYYTGQISKQSGAGAVWKWDSFSFNSVYQDEGQMAPCFGANVEKNISTAISGDKITALASGSFSVQLNCTCLFGMRTGSPWNVDLGHTDEFNATKASTY